MTFDQDYEMNYAQGKRNGRLDASMGLSLTIARNPGPGMRGYAEGYTDGQLQAKNPPCRNCGEPSHGAAYVRCPLS